MTHAVALAPRCRRRCDRGLTHSQRTLVPLTVFHNAATEESEQRRLAAASEKAQRASQFVGRVDSTQARAAALAEEQERAARLKAEAIEAQTLEAERRRVEALAEAKARATVLAGRVDVVGAKMKEAEKDQLELALEKERALQAGGSRTVPSLHGACGHP